MTRKLLAFALLGSVALSLVAALGCTEKVTMPAALPPGPVGPPLTPDSVQAIYDNRCVGCHFGSAPAGGMDLTAANSYANTVNVLSTRCAPLDRIEPNDPDNSCLVRRILGTTPPRMPFQQAPLTPEQITTIRNWISQGAPPTFAGPAL